MTARIPLPRCRRGPDVVNRWCLLLAVVVCVPLVTYVYLWEDQGAPAVSRAQKVKDRIFESIRRYSQQQSGPCNPSLDQGLDQPTLNVSLSLTSPASSPLLSTKPAPFKTNSGNSSSAGISREKFPDTFISPFIMPEKTREGTPKVEFKVDVDRRENLVTRDPNRRPVVARTIAYLLPCLNETNNCFLTERVNLRPCLFSNCKVTSDWREADVVVFYPFKMRHDHMILNFTKPARQRWVMFTPEAPCRVGYFWILNTTQFIGQFNWSLTYNLDSDIPQLYGKLKRVTPPPDKNYDAIYSSKHVPAAWFVSHCITGSLRKQYVTRMQTIVSVHIFGKCGNYTCAEGYNYRQSDNNHCFPLLSRKYFFYLAFENSFCVDYVTEKFFKIFTNADVIPVVRGGADYKRFFPSNTFIDASDFDSPESLGEYLKDLSQDKDRYIDMLKRKSEYKYTPVENWPCKLCEKMNKDTGVQWYPGNNMWTWFVKDQCNNPTHI